jgi:hypothetical protein
MEYLRIYHKTLIATHIVIMASLIFLCVGAFIVGKNFNETVTTINSDAIQLQTALTLINRERTGTLAGLNQVIFGADALMKQTNGVLNHEERQLSTIDSQELTLFTDLHKVLVNANIEVSNLQDTTKAATTSLNSANDSEKKFPDLIDKLDKILVDADDQINNPDIKKSVAAWADTSVQVEGTATNANKVTTHLEHAIDDPKKMTIKQKIVSTLNLLWKIGTLIR